MRKLFQIQIEDPLKTWRKAKKYFLKPKMYINFFSNIYSNCPFASTNHVPKILCVSCSDVGWKDKYVSPRHERSPYVWVCFFKRFGFSINWHITYNDKVEIMNYIGNGDMYYWEYLLNYLYYDKDLSVCDVWNNSKSKTSICAQDFSLNKEGLKLIRK